MDHILIANRRKLLGMSQAELAAAAGVSRESVNRFERKGTDIWLEVFRRLLDSLGLQVKIEAKNEHYPEDWAGFIRQSEDRLIEAARSHASPAENVESSRRIPAGNARVLDWGKF